MDVFVMLKCRFDVVAGVMQVHLVVAVVMKK